jgi:hypothetical protein
MGVGVARSTNGSVLPSAERPGGRRTQFEVILGVRLDRCAPMLAPTAIAVGAALCVLAMIGFRRGSLRANEANRRPRSRSFARAADHSFGLNAALDDLGVWRHSLCSPVRTGV